MGTFWEYMEKGGPVMWPLLVFSILGVAFSIERFVATMAALLESAPLPAEAKERRPAVA